MIRHEARTAIATNALARRGLRGALVLVAVACATAFVPGARAQETVVTLDPARTKIEVSVDSTLHTVHGTFQLKSGTIRFDPATGKPAGLLWWTRRPGIATVARATEYQMCKCRGFFASTGGITI